MPSTDTDENRSTGLSSRTLTVLSGLGIAAFAYPELSRLVDGEPIGDGVSDLLVAGLVVLLVSGLNVLDWVGTAVPLSKTQDRVAALGLFGVVVGGCVLTLSYFPDTPAAIGVLVPTVLGALFVVRDISP